MIDFLQLAQQEKEGYSKGIARKLAFYTATMSNLEQPTEVFQNSLYNLETNGSDDNVNSVVGTIKDEYNIALKNVYSGIALDPQLTSEEKVGAVKNLQGFSNIAVDVEREAQLDSAEKAGEPFSSLVGTFTVQDSALDLVRKRNAILQKEREDRSWLSGFGDFLLSSTPFSMNEVVLDLAEVLIPEFVNREDTSLFYSDINDADVGYLTAPGDVTTLIRRKYGRLSPEERPAFVKKMVETLKKNAGYTDDSLFVQEQVLNDIMGPYLNGEIDPDSQTGWEIFNNAIHWMDLTGAASFLKSSLKGGASLIKSPAGNMILPNPDGASELLKLAANEEALAEKLGVGAGDLTEAMIPHVEETGLLNMEESIASAKEILVAAQKEGFAYTGLEKQSVASRLMETVRTTEDVVPSPAYTKVEIATDNSYFNYNATYLNSEGKAFKSEKAARKAAEKNFEKYTVENGPKEGTYIIRVADAVPINRAVMKGDDLSFNDHNVFSLLNPAFTLSAPSARLSKDVVGMAWQASRRASKFSEGFSKIFQPFLSLNKKSKHRVSDAWLAGEKESRVFRPEELDLMGMSSKEMEGYYSGIRIGNVQYVINNQKLYQSLAENGFMTLENKASNFVNVAKTYDEARDGIVRTVYDATHDIIVPFNPEMSIGTMKGSVRLDSEATRFVLLDGETQLRALTKTPLKYNKGYIPRYYENNYFIRAIPKSGVMNGVETAGSELTQVVHAVDSQKAAKDVIESLKEQHPDMDFDFVRDRNTMLDVESMRFSDEEYQLGVAKGNLFFKGRGAKLGEEKFAGVDGSARTLDPVQSIVNAFQNVSFRAGYEDMLNSFKQRFISDFGEFSGGKYPERAADIVSRNPANKNEVVKARAYWKYINTLQGDRGWEAKTWRHAMLNLGEWMDDHGLHALGAGVQKTGKKDPFARGRGLAFNTMIAGNPLRQFALQSAQYLSLAGFDPKFILTGLPGAVAFRTAYWASKSTKKGVFEAASKAGAKAFGVTEKEFKSILKDFDDSGLVAEISSHSLARDSAKAFSEINSAETMLGLGYQKVRGAVSKPFQLGKKWGFAAGEANARAFTYLMARRQWVKKNPTKVWNEEAKREVNNLTEALVYSMNRADQYSYQQGLAGTIMQFFQVQHKAFANMLPTKLGGSKFTEGYKGRLALGSLLMYGAEGLSLGWLADKIVSSIDLGDNRVEVTKAVEGGLMEWMMNTVLLDDGSISLSKSLSPASGLYESATKFFWNMYTGEKPLFDSIPITNVGGRFKTLYKDLKMWNASGEDWDSDQMTLFINDVFKFASGYKNAYSAMQMNELGTFVNSNGTPVHQELFAEKHDAWAKLFGFNNKELEKAYEFQGRSFDRSKDFKEMVKDRVEYIEKLAGVKGINVQEALLIMQRGDRETLVPGEYLRLEKMVRDSLERKEVIKSSFDRLYEERGFGLGGPTGMSELNRLYNDGKISDEHYEQLKTEFTFGETK